MRKKNIIACILLNSILVLTLSGCGKNESELSKMSKSELIEQCETLEELYNELDMQYSNLKANMDEYEQDGEFVEAITTTGDGTGRFTFNSNDSKIIFPSSFTYPGSTAIVPDGKIDITSTVSVKPASTWITKINGASLELESTDSSISGTIKVNGIEENLDSNTLKTDVLSPWFESIANKKVVYTDIFIKGNTLGEQAEVPILINSENAYLICGMASYDSEALTYVFVYRGDEDSNKNLIIKELLNTIKINNAEFLIQN